MTIPVVLSIAIVILVCTLSFLTINSIPGNFRLAGNLFNIETGKLIRIGYLFVAGLLAIASLIRMWAGSALTSHRVMAFKVQLSQLTTTGPYTLVRNPIYLADLIAYIGFALCLNPVGLVLPVLIYIHYTQLVNYEEQSLLEQFGERFQLFKKRGE